MESKYQPQIAEEKIYRFWEENQLFKANPLSSKKAFSIILPPPNANADLHMGHAMYVYEDVMIRYHKLIGDEILWLPGADHAGIETQYVYEKQLAKQGKSRFDFDRKTLFKNIWDFVELNRGRMEQQLKKLGFALDWSTQKYTMDPAIIKIVYETFKKLFDAGLVYRAKKLVNYCTYCGTSFSDLEVVYKQKDSHLFYIKYPIRQVQGKQISNIKYITVATTRPETLLGDTAVAVNPKDKRYRNLIGARAIVPIVNREVEIIADEAVDPKFGTGAVKITPAHDFNDYDIAIRHNLPMKQVIDFTGRLNELTGRYQGLKVKTARDQVVDDLKKKGWIVKVEENYSHRVGTCYRCGRILEPLPKEQWFIKVDTLKKQAIKLIDSEKIKVYPRRFKKTLTQILDSFIDWNISRQIVWGIRIPAYKCRKMSNPKCQMSNGWFVSIEEPKQCSNCGSDKFDQDEDTFDTWFSSAQWPYATLLAQSRISNFQFPISNKKEKFTFFNKFYPSTVMETGYDIFRAWVSRMIMIGYFATGKVPFKNVFGHGMVRDRQGQKMSKSKGNVINPMTMVDKYGADALRISLIFETKEGGDLSFTEEKVTGMRNFVNKIWNIGRFIWMNRNPKSEMLNSKQIRNPKSEMLNKLINEFEKEKKDYFKFMESYQFSKGLGLIYEFLWHRYADLYIEQLKEELKDGNIKVLELMEEVFFENLKMLHPFAPFVTEAIYQLFKCETDSILSERL